MPVRHLILALLVLAAGASPARAASVVDQSLVGVGSGGTQIRTAYPRAAQTFLPGWTGTLTGVRLWLEQNGTVPVVVQIRTTQNGQPTNQVLTSAPLTTPGTPVEVALPPITVTAGQMYAIVVDTNGATGDNYMWVWNSIGGDPYPVGARWAFSGGWTFSGGDLAFQTLMVDDEVAPTTTLTPGSGWRAGPADVTVAAADDPTGTGLAGTRCWVDPPAPPAAYTTPGWRDCTGIAVAGEGEHAVYASSIDARGNAEVPHATRISIDLTPPATTATAPIGDVPGAVPVTLTARDAGSGVAATHYTVGVDPPAPTRASPVYDPAAPPVLERGERIRFRSVDAVGNLEDVRTSLPRLAAPAPLTPAAPFTVTVPGPVRLVAAPARRPSAACLSARKRTAAARRLVAKARRRAARDKARRRLRTAQAAERKAC